MQTKAHERAAFSACERACMNFSVQLAGTRDQVPKDGMEELLGMPRWWVAEVGLGSLVVLSQTLVQKPRISILIALRIGREKKEGREP